MSDEIPPPTDVMGMIERGMEPEPKGKPLVNGYVNGKANGQSSGHVVDLGSKRKGFEWRGSREVFVPMPATPWVSRELQVGPGRPAILAGYGASAKTYSAQSLVLSVATGRPVWGKFDCARGVAKHIDYEQGFTATARRYQWLAKGMGIDPVEADGRLFVASLPDCKLNSLGALDAYCKACEGASLVVIDSLRGGVPGEDENDSSIRTYVDMLTTVSERTGAAILIVHHAGKPKEGVTDPRALLRGSSALFDAAGAVYVVVNRKKDEPRLCTQVKLPADAGDGGVGEFGLSLRPVADEFGGPGGLVVQHVPIDKAEDKPKADEKFQRDAAVLIELIKKESGCSKRFLRAHAGFRGGRVDEVLDLLVEKGRVVILPGSSGKAFEYRIGEVGP